MRHSMNCDKLQKNLTDERDQLTAEVRDHLRTCAACHRFAERLEIAHQALRGHHAGVRPDPAFATRVVARLPQQSPILGWAALRLLPAATALLLVLCAWAWLGTDTASEAVASAPTDDLVSWVLENGALENGETGE